MTTDAKVWGSTPYSDTSTTRAGRGFFVAPDFVSSTDQFFCKQFANNWDFSYRWSGEA